MSEPYAYQVGSFGNRPYTIVSYQPIGTYAVGYMRYVAGRKR